MARKLLANAKEWLDEIPVLIGIVEAPTLRPDGTLLDQPGYDVETGLLFDPGGVEFPPVPEAPTREDALAALETLKAFLAGFPFVDESSLSVALSGIMTPLVRHACRAVPLFAITAPRMSSGKTLLATLAGYVLTGRPPRLMSQADSPQEDRKRLLAVLIEGAAVVVIDNVGQELKSDPLCTILTEPYYSGRLLGGNQIVTVPSRATFFATGNNLVLAGDVASRAVVCALDPKCERPEERTFDVNLHEVVPKRRAQLVAAVLTIVRAYLAAGEPMPKVKTFGRFEDWCRFVRYPLIWLGLADPYAGRARIVASDPVREQLSALLETWRDLLGSESVKVERAITEASREDPDQPTVLLDRKALREAMMEVAGRSGQLSPTGLGKFIARYENRIEGGLRFEKAGKAKGAVLWRVQAMDDQSQAPSTDENGEVKIIKKSKVTLIWKKKVPKDEQLEPAAMIACPAGHEAGSAKSDTASIEGADGGDDL